MNTDIILSSGVYRVAEIHKPTKARLFKDVTVGDKLEFSMFLRQTTGASNGLYATYIHVYHTGIDGAIHFIRCLSTNELLNRLKDFELVGVEACI